MSSGTHVQEFVVLGLSAMETERCNFFWNLSFDSLESVVTVGLLN